MNMASDDEDEEEDELDSQGEGRQSQADRRQSSVFDAPQTQQGEESSKPSE